MAFDWGRRMRFMLIGTIATVVLLVLMGTFFAIFYKVPSCIDRTQNQDEQGIDCGGSCPYLCAVSVEAPRVSYTRVVSPQKGRTDVIASIDNRNAHAAAKHVPYTVDLFGADGARITTVSGTVDLPPGKTVPVFIPAAAQGSAVATAFLTLKATDVLWYKAEPEADPVVLTDTVLTDGSAPRITASLVNNAFDPRYSVTAVAVVYNVQGNAIAASQTVVPMIASRSTAPVTFTWNVPFTEPADHVEVTALSPLP